MAYLSPEFLYLSLDAECIQDLENGFIAVETLNNFLFASDVWASACVLLDIVSGALSNPSPQIISNKEGETDANIKLQYHKILRYT